MLLEYLKGIDVKEVKEINANGHILKDDSDQWNEREFFESKDAENIKIISSNPDVINMECLRCNLKFNQRKLKNHLTSMEHLSNVWVLIYLKLIKHLTKMH